MIDGGRKEEEEEEDPNRRRSKKQVFDEANLDRASLYALGTRYVQCVSWDSPSFVSLT